jgi:outer membrane immunogenic protein
MKKVTFLGILSAALVFGALFGPLKAEAQPNPANWNGLYAGINVGVDRNYDNGVITCINPGGTVEGTGCDVPTFGHLTAQGGLAGVQAGYNFQFNRFLVGPELDWDASTLGATSAFTAGVPYVGGGGATTMFTSSESIGWLATGRLRLGWVASPKTLIYVTGGYARANGTAQSNFYFPGSGLQYPANENFQVNGFTEGIGGEWKIQPKASVKLEVTEFHLPNFTTLAPSTPAPTGYVAGKHFQFRGFTVRTGVNFQL